MYLGQRLVRGWTIEFSLIAMLLPFVVATVDLFARCRRRRIPIAPALRAYRSRLGVWLWAGAMFLFLALAGVWPGGAARPLNPETPAAGDWPMLGLLLLLFLVRSRLARRPLQARTSAAGDRRGGARRAHRGDAGAGRRRPARRRDESVRAPLPAALAPHLALASARCAITGLRRRLALLAAGLVGPFILVGSFMFRFGLGFDAPWYLAELVAINYVSTVAFLLVLCWLAGAAQLTAIAAGRYAPYPSAAERPPRGPIRNAVRAIVLGVRARRTVAADDREALGA